MNDPLDEILAGDYGDDTAPWTPEAFVLGAFTPQGAHGTTRGHVVDDKGKDHVVWLTSKEAAQVLRISRRTLDRMKEDTPKSVAAPWRRVGGQVRWHRDRLDSWVDALNNRKPKRRR